MRNIKTILVTGGSGFIGSNFCHVILQGHPYNIINIDELTYASKDKIVHIQNTKNYKFYKKNICDEGAVKSIFAKYPIDAVVHFAAETHVDNSIHNSDSFIQSNILGTHTLIKICNNLIKQKKLNQDFVFIHISTDEVFGHLNKKDPAFTEETKYNPRNPYSATKAAADHIVRSFIATYQFPAIVVNCCNNYGPYQHEEKLIPKIIHNIMQNKPIPIYGQGKQMREWIYATDFAKAILRVLQHAPMGESYNIGSGEELENITMTKMICKLMDNKLKRKTSASKLITFVEDRLGHDFRYAINSSKIRRTLQWKPEITIELGLEKTIDHYLEYTNPNSIAI